VSFPVKSDEQREQLNQKEKLELREKIEMKEKVELKEAELKELELKELELREIELREIEPAQAEPSAVSQEQFPNLGERYEVLALIGRGGMGVVYKVRDKAVDKIFAVKVLNQDLVQDKISVKRFEQEAKAASALTHANLAAVYDYGVGVSGCPFLVMDYLEGHTLE
jgi:hypothetical protein